MDESKTVLLHLSLVYGVGPRSVLNIIKMLYEDFCTTYKNPHIQNPDLNIQKLYSYSVQDFVCKFYLKEKVAKLLVAGLKDKSKLEKELALIQKYKIDIYSFLDSEYPDCLKQIYSPPIMLYCKGGDLGDFETNFAVIGARKAGEYAQQIIHDIVPKLVEKKYTIVSGGAIGADSMAHKATLDFGGKTIVVLGSGLLEPYPKENKELFRQVLRSGGTLVSPFPLQAPPERGNFPARNRIIAGLSKACLVVQAARKSGALITAKFALDEGRTVFAVPGSVYDELSLGCHELINQGAKLVNSIDDICDDFGENQVVIPIIVEKKETKKIKKIEKVIEDPILGFLKEPSSIDELSVKTGLDLFCLQDKLFDLQLSGKVKQNIAGLWEKA